MAAVAWSGPRTVLIEHPDVLAAVAAATRLRRAGLAVAVCHGPHAKRPCPVLSGGRCPPAERADVIVAALGESGEAIGAAHRVRRPHVTIVELDGDFDAETVRAAVRVAIRGD